MIYLPERGSIVWINLNPRKGHEQSGHRPCLVLSDITYHEKSKLAIICPITTNISPWPWKVILPEECIVQGAILVDSIRSIDREDRKIKYICTVNKEVLDEVNAKLCPLINLEV